MAVSLTTITGPVYLPNGATPIGGRVSFELSSWDQEEGEALIISGPVYSTIDENGQFSVELYTSTAGVNSVHYRMFVIWEDSQLSESYVNDIYVGTPTPHYTKKYIGSFALSGLGPFQVSDLNIVSETNNSSFDAYLEMKAFADRIDLGALDDAVAATEASAAQTALNVATSSANASATAADAVQTGLDRSASSVSASEAAASASEAAATLSTRLEKSLNLSDLTNAAAARDNLGLSGVGSLTIAQSADIDAITAGGMYSFGTAATGSPAPGAAGSVLHVTGNASTAAYQIASIYGSQAVFRRAKSGGVWGAWDELQIKNPTNLLTIGSADNAFAGGIQGRNNGAGTAAVPFDANIRGAGVGGMHVISDASFGASVRLLANRTGGADGDRRFTALQINSDGQQFSAHVGDPATVLPQFSCRAWVNFNGTNGAIRAAGNVSSVVRNGVGDYTINFATAMPDAGYSVAFAYTDEVNVTHAVGFITSVWQGSFRLRFHNAANSANMADKAIVTVVIFR